MIDYQWDGKYILAEAMVIDISTGEVIFTDIEIFDLIRKKLNIGDVYYIAFNVLISIKEKIDRVLVCIVCYKNERYYNFFKK